MGSGLRYRAQVPQSRCWASSGGRGRGLVLIQQAEPFTAFDPVSKGLQHGVRTHTRFRPVPSGTEFSSLYSPFGHCRWFAFTVCVHCTSIFLPSLAPWELPHFIATMLALNSL